MHSATDKNSITLFRKKKRCTRCCCYKKFQKQLMEQDNHITSHYLQEWLLVFKRLYLTPCNHIFGRHFVCYFAHAFVKRTWAKASYQPIRQKSPLLTYIDLLANQIVLRRWHSFWRLFFNISAKAKLSSGFVSVGCWPEEFVWHPEDKNTSSKSQRD